jgi:hypothetical protein
MNARKLDSQSPLNPAPIKSRIISRIITAAVQLWLRSQVEHIDELQVTIEGGDRQILSGYIPQVSLAAQNAVYRGLHLSKIHLIGENICINLGQVIKGQPLRLLEPIPVDGELCLREIDLNASLQAPLLVGALIDVLLTLLPSEVLFSSSPEPASRKPINSAHVKLQESQITLETDQLTLRTTLVSEEGNLLPIVIRTGLQLVSRHVLQLAHPQWFISSQAEHGLPLADLAGFCLDLGPEVSLEELKLERGQISCRGHLTVFP